MKPQVGLKKTKLLKLQLDWQWKRTLKLLQSGIKGDFTTHLIKKIFKNYKDNIMNNLYAKKI